MGCNLEGNYVVYVCACCGAASILISSSSSSSNCSRKFTQDMHNPCVHKLMSARKLIPVDNADSSRVRAAMLQVFRAMLPCAPKDQPAVRCFAGAGVRFPPKDAPTADHMRSCAFPLGQELLWTEYARIADYDAATRLAGPDSGGTASSAAGSAAAVETLFSSVLLCGGGDSGSGGNNDERQHREGGGDETTHSRSAPPAEDASRVRNAILKHHASFEKWMDAMQPSDLGMFSDYYHNVASYRYDVL